MPRLVFGATWKRASEIFLKGTLPHQRNTAEDMDTADAPPAAPPPGGMTEGEQLRGFLERANLGRFHAPVRPRPARGALVGAPSSFRSLDESGRSTIQCTQYLIANQLAVSHLWARGFRMGAGVARMRP